MSRPLRLVILAVLAALFVARPASAVEECVPEPEIPGDGVDQDCDGYDGADWFVDADGDGYGNDSGNTVLGIETGPGPGQSANMLDCVDSGSIGGIDAGDINPAATETWYDGVDQNCAGDNDFDLDHDTYVAEGHNSYAGGTAPNTGDCDDSDTGRNPGAAETPDNGIDENCNGFDMQTYYLDDDEDGYGDSFDGGVIVMVDGPVPANVSLWNTDCNDSEPTINPGEIDTPGDAIDQNCNGYDATLWILDDDEDGYGNASGTVIVADGPQPSNGSITVDDCDDDDASINPGAAEAVDDGVDQDCDGRELFYLDADDDGFRPDSSSVALAVGMTIEAGLAHSYEPAGDCNDSVDSIHPGATETVADGVDQDCDGGDSFYLDADDDGYGTQAGTVIAGSALSAGAFESTVATDCDDSDPSIHPDAEDVAGDRIDQNCDGADTPAPAVTTTTTSATTTTTLPPGVTTTTAAAGSSSSTTASTPPSTDDVTTTTSDDSVVIAAPVEEDDAVAEGSGAAMLLLGLTLVGAGAGAVLWFFRFR